MSNQDYATVDGKQVQRSDFGYVPDDMPSHWKFPLDTEGRVRDAMSRFNQEKGIPHDAMRALYHKILSRAHKYGMDTSNFEKEHGGAFRASEEAMSERGQSILLDELPRPIEEGGRRIYRLPVLMAGEWHMGTRKVRVTDAHLRQMSDNFRKRRNGELNVDYEHASEMPEVAAGGPVPSAGSIVQTEAGAALMADFDFTSRAEQMIRDREYRYLSPAFVFHARSKATGEDQGATLTSVALTNKPFLEELPAIRLSEIDLKAEPEAGGKNQNGSEEPEGGAMEKLTAKASENGKLIVFRGSEELGSVELDQAQDRKKLFAELAGEIGAEGKTAAEVKKLTEAGAKHLAREQGQAACSLLMTECAADGKLDRAKMRALFSEKKITGEVFLLFDDAWQQVDGAIKAGKFLPASREQLVRIAFNEAEAFAKLAEAQPKVIATEATGFEGSEQGMTGAAGSRVNPGHVTPQREDVDRQVKALMSESKVKNPERPLTYAEAYDIVMSREQQ